MSDAYRRMYQDDTYRRLIDAAKEASSLDRATADLLARERSVQMLLDAERHAAQRPEMSALNFIEAYSGVTARLADPSSRAHLSSVTSSLARAGAIGVAESALARLGLDQLAEARTSEFHALHGVAPPSDLRTEINWLTDHGLQLRDALNGTAINIADDLATTATALAGVTDLKAILQQTYADAFRLPSVDESARLAADAFNIAGPGTAAFLAEAGLASSQAYLAGLTTPWLQSGQDLASAQAMLQLQGLGLALHHPPYEDPVAELIRAQLGDWRDEIAPDPAWSDPTARLVLYETRGFDRRLTDFTPAAFAQGLRHAGLQDDETADEDEAADAAFAAEDEDLRRAQAAQRRLQRFEVGLRRFLDAVMSQAFGENWPKHRLPNGLYDAWLGKQATAVQAGRPALPLVAYADFNDYPAIITRTDNWTAVFVRVFGRQELVRESFQRMRPLRHDTAHARGFTSEDELYLRVEVRRLRTAIQRAGH